MCDGSITENPIINNQETETEQKFYTSYNIVRKTIYYYKNNRYHNFKLPEQKEQTNYEQIRRLLKQIKNTVLSEKMWFLLEVRKAKTQEKADKSIAEFFEKWF
jgi:hypothetical protein